MYSQKFLLEFNFPTVVNQLHYFRNKKKTLTSKIDLNISNMMKEKNW